MYSLKYKGHQWLKSTFPNIEISSDYNPWFGGIQTLPEDWDFNSKPVLKEKIKTDFIEISDSCGNIWHGINSRLLIKEYNEFKGLEINEYFLMLPKVPVLCHVIEVSQDMKIFMKDRAFITKTFFNLNNDLTKSYVVAENEEHDFIKYRGGMG